MAWIEHATSPLPRECSTTELHGRNPNSLSGAGEGNRTLVLSLEGFSSTIELHPPDSKRSNSPPRNASRRHSYCANCWWRGKDSNLRTQRGQIYSLLPLTTRPPLQRNSGLSSEIRRLSMAVLLCSAAPFARVHEIGRQHWAGRETWRTAWSSTRSNGRARSNKRSILVIC